MLQWSLGEARSQATAESNHAAANMWIHTFPYRLKPQSQARRISHFTSLMLTSSPAFSSYSNHSPSTSSMPVNFVPDSTPVASHSPSGLNSMNSSPLQSNSRMLTFLAGSDCSYGLGASLMFAVCSRY
jgi:hypothetical protein